MTRELPTTAVSTAEPSIGPWIPTAIAHIAFTVVAAGACLLVLELGLFRRAATVSDVSFYLLLAGGHLLHVLRSVAALLPWHGRMQVAALRRPLQRFVCVQAIVQPVAFSALFAFGGAQGTVQGVSICSAAVLGVVAVVLARAMRTTVPRG